MLQFDKFNLVVANVSSFSDPLMPEEYDDILSSAYPSNLLIDRAVEDEFPYISLYSQYMLSEISESGSANFELWVVDYKTYSIPYRFLAIIS
jgi:hypothetical protein